MRECFKDKVSSLYSQMSNFTFEVCYSLGYLVLTVKVIECEGSPIAFQYGVYVDSVIQSCLSVHIEQAMMV